MRTQERTQELLNTSMKDLGLFTPYDVSKWCAQHGIVSVYIEKRKTKFMSVSFKQFEKASVVVKDCLRPGVEIAKFTLRGDERRVNVALRAQAWVEATYDIKMKYLPSMGGYFPAPAVDLLLDELDNFLLVWNPLKGAEVSPVIKKISKVKEAVPNGS